MLRGGGGSAGAGSLPHRPQAALGRRRPVPPGHALPAPSACTVLLAASARPPRAPAAHAPLRARVRPSEHPREPSQSERRARARWSEKEAAAAAQAAPSVCPLLADAGKMEAVIEKECSALGGLFQTIISDMKKDPEVACVFTMSAAYHLQSCNHRPPGELSSLGRFHKQSRKATVPASMKIPENKWLRNLSKATQTVNSGKEMANRPFSLHLELALRIFLA
ncbi:uncharacterized protein [Manis javanica]|uniref:uncharacterized protein isoform X2 n=1 Tax=Manis javanica TaxID=9974 RepID=UPI003C6D3508